MKLIGAVLLRLECAALINYLQYTVQHCLFMLFVRAVLQSSVSGEGSSWSESNGGSLRNTIRKRPRLNESLEGR